MKQRNAYGFGLGGEADEKAGRVRGLMGMNDEHIGV